VYAYTLIERCRPVTTETRVLRNSKYSGEVCQVRFIQLLPKDVPSVMYNQVPSSAGRPAVSHLKSIAFESEEVSLQKLRERLRLMSDARRVRLIAFTAVHPKFTSGALIE